MNILSVFWTLLAFVFILIYLFKFKPNIFIVLHLISFWLFIMFFNTVGMFFNEFKYDEVVFIATNILLITYIFVFMGLGVGLRKRMIDNETLLNSLIEIKNWKLYLAILAYVAFKIYFFSQFGLEGLVPEAFKKYVSIPYWVLSLNSLLIYPALGSFFILLLKIINKFRIISNPILSLNLFLFFIFFILFNEINGARRFFIFLLVFLLLASLHFKNYKLKPSLLIITIFFFSSGIIFSDYFQKIRENVTSLYINNIILSGDTLEGIYLYIKPMEHYSELSENLRVRYSPFWVIYQINEIQTTNLKSSQGSIIAQSFENVMPNVLYPSKEYVNADILLLDEYDLSGSDDLPSGVLSIFQSDFLFFGFVITPAVYILLFLFYNRMIRINPNNSLVLLVGFSIMLLTAFYVESTFDAILVDFRNFLLFLMAAFLIYLFKNIVVYKKTVRKFEMVKFR